MLLAALVIATSVPTTMGQAALSTSTGDARVNLLLSGEPDNLDPSRASFASAGSTGVARQLFEPLLRLDEHLVPQPAAAASYDISADGTVYTFHLRPDGRWSDGAPVTAGQFVFGWRRLLDPAARTDYSVFFVAAGVSSVSAPDDLTFEVHLDGPFGPLPNLAALWVAAPLRPDLVSANPDAWAKESSTTIGNGPFAMSEWVHGDHLTLVPNPAYVDHGVWPRPGLARVTVTMQTSDRADLAAFLDGARDWTLVPDSDVNAVLNDPTLAPLARTYNELTTFWIGINTSRAPLDNLDVRRALSKGIDRAAVVRDTAAGTSLPTTSIIPKGMPGFAADLGKDVGLDEPGGRTLLAGAHLDPDRPLTFSYPNSPSFQRRAEYIQAQWQDHIGLSVKLVPLDDATYGQAMANKDYDLAFGGWSADYPDPQDWFDTLFTCAGAFNSFSYCNTSVDQAVARADIAAALPDRLAEYARVHTLIVRDLPVIPLFTRGRLALVRPWMRSSDGGPLPITAADEYPGTLLLDKAAAVPH
ncbi:MAG: ABC transporter substrate-binding protein [Chloroflexota bacterium]